MATLQILMTPKADISLAVLLPLIPFHMLERKDVERGMKREKVS